MTEADETSHLRAQLREAMHANNLQRVRINMLEVALEHYVYLPHVHAPCTTCTTCAAGKRLVDEGRELLRKRLGT